MSTDKKTIAASGSTSSTNPASAGSKDTALASTAATADNPNATATPPSVNATAQALGLQQVVANPERYPLQLDQRTSTILGSKMANYANAPAQSLIAVRDETSGQVEWYGQGLQFKVSSKAALDAVQAQYPKLEILIATTDFVNAKLELGDIVNYYNAMQGDTRIQDLRLLPIVYPVKPR